VGSHAQAVADRLSRVGAGRRNRADQLEADPIVVVRITDNRISASGGAAGQPGDRVARVRHGLRHRDVPPGARASCA
jgi:hypothetical protein